MANNRNSMRQPGDAAWPQQLVCLQALYSLRFLQSSNGDSSGGDSPNKKARARDGRSARLVWAAQIIRRPISSFKELRTGEAAQLIDLLKCELGQESRPARQRPARGLAHSYGTSGRRGNAERVVNLVDGDTRGLLDGLLAQLGWTPQHFEAFLHSKSSPLRSGAIRTLAEANRAIWALKGMLRRRAASSSAREESVAKVS